MLPSNCLQSYLSQKLSSSSSATRRWVRVKVRVASPPSKPTTPPWRRPGSPTTIMPATDSTQALRLSPQNSLPSLPSLKSSSAVEPIEESGGRSAGSAARRTRRSTLPRLKAKFTTKGVRKTKSLHSFAESADVGPWDAVPIEWDPTPLQRASSLSSLFDYDDSFE